jgi:hypothetical protein
MRPAPISATTGNASPLLARSVITLMLSCAGSNTLDELQSHVSARISSGPRILSWLDGD